MDTNNQEQAFQEVGRYLQLNREARIHFTRRAQVDSFRDKIALQVQPWLINYSKSMTCVQLCTHPSDIVDNLEVALLMEAVGLGPSRYCIVHHPKHKFPKQFKTIMFFLPPEKMFLYPAGGTLGGPFFYKSLGFLEDVILSQDPLSPSLSFLLPLANLMTKLFFSPTLMPCMV